MAIVGLLALQCLGLGLCNSGVVHQFSPQSHRPSYNFPDRLSIAWEVEYLCASRQQLPSPQHQSLMRAGMNRLTTTSLTEYFEKQAGDDRMSVDTRERAGIVTYDSMSV